MCKRLTVLAALGILVVLPGCSQEFSILAPGSANARAAAGLWWGMFFWFTVVMFCVVGLWFYAIRKPPPEVPESRARTYQRSWLVWGGLVLPILSMAVILAFGIPAGHRMLPLNPAGDVFRVDITARQWHWEVLYPVSGIRLQDELHIPAQTAIDVHLTSADVIHSFWVPRLGGKLDMLPSRTNVLRLHAESPGTYRGQCAEFCGRGHAHMKFTVVAHHPEDFRTWEQQERSDE